MTSTFLTPYLYFGGNCREAMNFYQDIFGGDLTVMTFGDSYPAEAEHLRDQVMHANIMEGPIELMACDDPEGHNHGLGNVRLTLHGTDEATLSAWFDRLAEGGTVLQAPERQVWGDVYGELTDRFGVRWMLNIGTTA